MSDKTLPPDGLIFPNARSGKPKKNPAKAGSTERSGFGNSSTGNRGIGNMSIENTRPEKLGTEMVGTERFNSKKPNIKRYSNTRQKYLPVIPAYPAKFRSLADTSAQSSRLKNRSCKDMVTAKNIIEFRHQLLRLFSLIGFSDFFFQKLFWMKSAKQPFGTLPRQLLAIYEDGKYFKHDLALQHVRTTTSPVFMSSIEYFISEARIKPDTFRRYGELIDVCKSFDYHDFYYMPLKARDDSYSVMLSVTVKGMNSVDFRRKVEMHKEELHLLANAVFCKGVSEFPSLFLDTKSSRKVNGSRPMQLLYLLAIDDMSLKQAADKLCISIDTANKHIASAKKVWGVRTQAAAVYRAVKAGVIEI